MCGPRQSASASARRRGPGARSGGRTPRARSVGSAVRTATGGILSETFGARRGRAPRERSWRELLVVVGRLLRRRSERDHLLAVDEDVVLGGVLVRDVVAGAAI